MGLHEGHHCNNRQDLSGKVAGALFLTTLCLVGMDLSNTYDRAWSELVYKRISAFN